MKTLRKRQLWLLVAAALGVLITYGAWKRSVGIDQVLPPSHEKVRIDASAADRRGLQGVAYSTATQPQLVVQVGHAADLTTVSFSPDGRFILTGSRDATAWLWDAATGVGIRRFIHEFPLWFAAFSPDGRFIVTRTSSLLKDRGDYAYLWDAATGAEMRRFTGHAADAEAIAFAPDSNLLVTAGDDNLAYLWETSTGQEVRRLVGHTGRVEAVRCSPQGDFILTGSSDQTARLWDTVSGREVQQFTGHTGAVTVVEFSPLGQLILTGSADGTARLWEMDTGREVLRLEGPAVAVMSATFSPDGRFILTKTSDGIAYLWNASTSQKLQQFEKEAFVTFSPDGHLVVRQGDAVVLQEPLTGNQGQRFPYGHPIAFSPNGRFLAAGDSSDKSLRLWEVATGQEARRFTGQVTAVRTVTFSPDGRWLITGSDYYGAHLWEMATGRIAHQLNTEESVGSVAFSPDSRFVITGGWAARLWEVATGKEVRQFGKPSLQLPVAFSPDGRFVVTGQFKDAIVWDTASGKEVRRFVHQFLVNSVAISPDGHFVLTASGESDPLRAWSLSRSRANKAHKAVLLWEIATGKILQEFGLQDVVHFAAFSPGGRFITMENSSATSLWDVASGQWVGLVEGLSFDGTPAVFSPDGRLILTGSSSFWQQHASVDFTARLYSLVGEEKQRFVGHSYSVHTVSFSPDGHLIATGSGDGTVRLWNPVTGQELCRLLSFPNGDWVVVDPEGRFDTNNLDNNRNLYWVMSDDPFTPLPLEVFMRDYYEPRLLPRILAGEKFRPVRALRDLNRVQPTVKITKIDSQANVPDTVRVTVEATKAAREFQRGDKQVRVETGVYDLRLFRDGQLVGYAPELDGEIAVDPKTGAAVQTFAVRLPHTGTREVEFSAYAFNVDRVKSATDRKTFQIPTAISSHKGRAYLVTVGVNAYENPAWDLRFAANDARQLVRTLHTRLAGTRAYDDIIPIALISDSDKQSDKRVMTANSATKRNVQTVLALLAGKEVLPEQRKELLGAETIHPVRPEDLVLLSFSSHGHADANGLFYLFPFDIGPGQEKVVTPELLRHAISSDDLSRWLRDVDAGEVVLIVDACHSAAGVEGEGFKPGPMGSRGLGQLAYDKGMRILTASQADDVAIESNLLQQGLLTYALLQDGLEAGQADFQPRDRRITLTEWLRYGAERVPKLYTEVRSGQLQQVGQSEKTRAAVVEYAPQSSSLKRQGVQQPALFDFAKRQGDTILTSWP